MITTILSALCDSQCNVAIPKASELAIKYYNSSNILWIIQQFWAMFIPLLFLITRFSKNLSIYSEKYGKKWIVSIAVYFITFYSISGLLDLPIKFYSNYIHEHAYGLSNQTISKWFSNYGKSFSIGLVTSLICVSIFYLMLKKSPRRWWIYSSFLAIGFVFISAFIQPILIDPLFNNFGPMKDKELEKNIQELAQKAGIENYRIFEVDKSKDTKKTNAYVCGIGSSKRIVIWDTTIKQMTKDELLFVVGHEIGHYILNHMWWFLFLFSISSFFTFYLIYRISIFLLSRYQTLFGFNNLANIASLPLLLLVSKVLIFFIMPLSNYFSRYDEHEADRFGLEITQNNKAAARAFITLQKDNLANPRPGKLYILWRASHPSLGDRIDFSNNYCPWNTNEKLKYGKYFKPKS